MADRNQVPTNAGNAYAYMNPHGLANGYVNLYGSGSGSSRAVERRTPGPGHASNSYGAGAVVPSPSFNGMYAPHQVPTTNSYAANAVPPLAPNGGLPRSPPQTGSQERNDDVFITDRLRSLTIGNGHLDSRRRSTTADFGDGGRQQDRRTAGAADVDLDVYAADPYSRAWVETVRGRAGRVARNHRGCQFLRRMVAARGADAVRDVFDQVAGDVVRLMGHRVAAPLVEDMAKHWTDEQVARVLRTLAASPPRDLMMAARNNAGSNVLRTLVSKIEGRGDQIECFARCLASVGEANLFALVTNQAGSRVIQKCLDAFPPEHNRSVVAAVVRHRYAISYDQHGCHVMRLCIDSAAVIDAGARDCLVGAVCADGLALAQDDFGNFVVQHVIRAAPWSAEWLHPVLRGWYAALTRQKASSNVVQLCLELFPQAYSDQIVWELLRDPGFRDLIDDPYANYVLQSAIRRTRGPLLQVLAETVRPYRNMLRDNIHARKVLQMLFTPRRWGVVGSGSAVR